MAFRDQKTICVRSPEGRPCPIPGRPGAFYSVEPQSVANDFAHRKMIEDGSLVLVVEQPKKPAAKKANE